MQQPPKKLLDQVRDAIRLKHYAYRTEETYVQWIRRYILFHNKRHPKDMGSVEIEAFLTHLAVHEQVAASTQNQALNALLFLYREVLKLDVAQVNAVRAKRSQYLPTVLTKEEALARKYANAGREWVWQFVFPSIGIPLDLRSGLRYRHHLHESSVQKAVKQATRSAGIQKRVGCHRFRHRFATHYGRTGMTFGWFKSCWGIKM